MCADSYFSFNDANVSLRQRSGAGSVSRELSDRTLPRGKGRGLPSAIRRRCWRHARLPDCVAAPAPFSFCQGPHQSSPPFFRVSAGNCTMNLDFTLAFRRVFPRTQLLSAGLGVTLALAGLGCDSEASTASTATKDASIASDSAADGSAADGTAADGTAADGSAATTIELLGTWATNFGSDETITADKWGPQKIASFDNAANVAYTQNPPDDKFGPNKFSKQVWTELKGNSFYYCTIDYGKDSIDLAKASTLVADSKDPDKSGCGGFGWTKMTKKP